MTDTRPKPTPAMIKFVAECNQENAVNSQKREKIVNRLSRKRDEIADALIGIGVSLKSLAEQKEIIEKELDLAEKQYIYKDVGAKFQEKFGVTMWRMNFDSPLTQEEVDSIIEIEEE